MGGYASLGKALFEMTPDEVLAEVKKANLRRRGGGGFPAGLKWETAKNAPWDEKYVIVNAHVDEPGAFMDRALFAGNPHKVTEGLIIGAYAIGSRRPRMARDKQPTALLSESDSPHAAIHERNASETLSPAGEMHCPTPPGISRVRRVSVIIRRRNLNSTGRHPRRS